MQRNGNFLGKEEVIDLIDSSSSDEEREAKLPASKRQRREKSQYDCPIKLFATKQDEQYRLSNPGDFNHWSYSQCWTLREMIGFEQNPHDIPQDGAREAIDYLIISNFLLDFSFLTQAFPEIFTIPTVIIFYHDFTAELPTNHPNRIEHLQMISQWKSLFTGTVSIQALNPRVITKSNRVRFRFGCHHTKFFIAGCRSRRLRVIVHTANMTYADIHNKCQGAYLQDFYPKTEDALYETSPFETALTDYLASYRYLDKHKWHPVDTASKPTFLLDEIANHDFSTAKGILIPSIPGNHFPSTKADKWGYRAIQQAIKRYVKKSSSVSNQHNSDNIICQFSSIGSLSAKYLKDLWNAWDVHTIHRDDEGPSNRGPHFQFVWPTENEICQSVEGSNGGGSVPGRQSNVNKPCVQGLLHKWTTSVSKPSTLNKSRNIPHIKTYFQANEQSQGMHYFVLSSHNLSKTAFGEQQNGHDGPKFVISHWELGIFVSPSTLGVDALIPYGSKHNGSNNEKVCTIPLPYHFLPEPYASTDRPWTID